MATNLTTREERRGWRMGFLWAVPIALVVGCIVVVAVYWSNMGAPDTGMQQTVAPGATDTTTPKASGPATLKVEQTAEYGSFLTDDSGHPLYLFEGDHSDGGKAASTCYEECAKAWPPLLSSGQPHAASGVKADLVSTRSRKSGSDQVTYNGWPLYRYAKDVGPEKAVGQDVKDFGAQWHLVTPSGEKVQAQSQGGEG